MTRILVYGNCQGGPIGRLIERANPSLEVVRAPPVHLVAASGVAELEAMFRSADIVLSQPIGANWGRLGSASLREVFGKPDWIEYPSIYFGGLFPYLRYIRIEPHKALQGPLGDYHDQRIATAFIEGLSEEECVRHMTVSDVDECRRHFETALAESRQREVALPIKVMDFVERHMRQRRLFHTFNHPSNAVMWSVVTQFLQLISAKLEVPVPPVNQYLGNVSASIPPELAEAVGINCADDHYRLNRAIVEPADLVRDFYRVYARTPGFENYARAARGADL